MMMMMKMIAILLVTIFMFQFITTAEIIPERVETVSGNSCLHTLNFTFRKRSRKSPYYIDFDFNATAGYGNNLTIQWKLSEYISGRYVPIPVQFEYRLCDFLNKDQYLGQMYAKQLRGNWSCPFPPGRSIFKNLVTHIENFPTIPFTYASLIVRIRADLNFFIGPPIVQTTEIFPERVETESGDSCLHTINFTFRKRSRNSPSYIDFDFNATAGYGNNLTIKWKTSEYISGRYVPIPVQFEYRLCDFLYKDQYLGQMFAKQLRGNWSCPFPPGRSIFKNLVTHVENFPTIPFTYASLIVRVRVDLIFFIGPPIVQVAIVKVYMTMKQKIKNSKF